MYLSILLEDSHCNKGRAYRRVPARFASSSEVTSRSSSSGGFLCQSHYVEHGKTKITTLPNGLKIASETSANHSASIALHVDCGTIYESPPSFGASFLLEHMAFKTTSNRSHSRIVRKVEAIGGYVYAAASREQIRYAFDGWKTYVPEMVELLIDCVRNPVFLDREINEQLQKVKEVIAEPSKNPMVLLLEGIHSAGYSGALANPLLPPESAIDILNGTVLKDFVAENFTASRMVLAAYGVEHEELLSVAESFLSDLPSSPRPQKPKSVYTGGDYRCQADSGDQTHFALVFELPGGRQWHNEKEYFILTIIQLLMGGGSYFSTAAPGKGMYSRLNHNFLSSYPEVQSFTSFNNVYSHSSIFGVQVTTDSDFVPTAIEIAVKVLIGVATPGKVRQEELDGAKRATKFAILNCLEDRMVVLEDIGKQVMACGVREPVEYFLKALDEITLADISSVTQKLLSSPLTLASYGNVIDFPSYDSVSSKFK